MARSVPALLAFVVLLAALPGVAAAESRTGGTVVVAEGETVSEDLQATGGTVRIEGTVDGDVQAFAGSVVVAGEITGDLETSAGTVEITGSVGGDVSAAGGDLEIRDGGSVGGELQAAGGSVRVDGAVGEDAVLAADTVSLGPNAQVEGDLRYDGELSRADGATVAGGVTRDEGIDAGPTFGFGDLPTGALAAYGVLANLVAGAVLLIAFPRFSGEIADRVADDPVRSGGFGLLAAVAVPLALLVLLVTVVGIPLSLAGGLVFAVLVWVGAVYGRFALGAWLLSLADVDNRWLALVAGVVLVAVAKFLPVPFVGNVLDSAVFLLGFGALVLALWSRYSGEDDPGGTAPVADDDPVRDPGAT